MSIIWFLLIGIVAGWIAGELTKGSGYGLSGNILVGLLGALLGGFAPSLLGVEFYGIFGELLSSVVGSVVVLLILSLFRGEGMHRTHTTA